MDVFYVVLYDTAVVDWEMFIHGPCFLSQYKIFYQQHPMAHLGPTRFRKEDHVMEMAPFETQLEKQKQFLLWCADHRKKGSRLSRKAENSVSL